MKKAKKRQIMAGLMLGCMISGTLAGCGSKKEETAQSSISEAESTVSQTDETVGGEADQLTLFLTNKNMTEGSFVKTYVEEATNTKLTIIQVATSDLDNKLNMMLAAGDWSDIIQCETETMESRLLSSGMLLPLNEYWDDYPNLKNARDEATWDLMRYNDGNIYSIGIDNPNPLSVIAYRKDWLDALGLKVPTTLDEYYETAAAVAKNDPDGNGKDDTFAFGGYQNVDTSWFDHIFGAFGSLPNYWRVRDGHIVNGSVQPEMKEALIYLNKMYEDGFIDPEFVTDDYKRWQQKVKSGIYGAGVTKIHIFDRNNWSNYYVPFKEAYPDGEIVYGPVLQGGSDEPVGIRRDSDRGWLRTFIYKDSKNVDACLRLLDWVTSEEGNRFLQYGLEGEHYKIENGRLVKTIDSQTANELDLDKLYLGYTVLFEDASLELLDAFEYAEAESVADPTDGYFDDELNETYPKLKELTNTRYIKMIVGEIPVEGGFEEFVEEWNTRGGDKVTAAMDAMYQERKK